MDEYDIHHFPKEEKTMDEATQTNGERIGGATALSAAAPKRQSQLERFANELAKQGELLNILESKLDVVSERSPKDGATPMNDRIHISTLVDVLGANNRRINQFIDEITL
jgi:hypothetical protein